MAKYISKRILHAIFSVIVVVGIVMLLIYSLLNRNQIFESDPNYIKVSANRKTTYKYEQWESYGYLDYVNYTEWLTELVSKGELDEDQRSAVAKLGRTAEKDSDEVAAHVKRFTEYYQGKGYEVIRLDTIMAGRSEASGGKAQLFATKDKPLISRLLNYFGNLFQIDKVTSVENYEGERGLDFTWHDPLYGEEKFSPAIIGRGTKHKYLLYCDDKFPFIHQNLFSINLGVSYSVNKDQEVLGTMTRSQGS